MSLNSSFSKIPQRKAHVSSLRFLSACVLFREVGGGKYIQVFLSGWGEMLRWVTLMQPHVEKELF